MPPSAVDYEAVIGLEFHAELRTETKIFCGCRATFGEEPNAHVCAVCLGMPGPLPVLNERVLEFAIRTGLALNSRIAAVSKFDRKNYFYPDLPKAYQISQFDMPICEGGHLDIPLPDGGTKRIGITRAHMEEDAGKLVHAGSASLAGSTHSYVDLNRAGVPLLEIVSDPDLRSAEEAKAYGEELRAILVYLGVCDGRMEEGSLRCDANVSIRPRGAEKLGTRAELKNMNSFRAVQRAIEYEIARQIALVESGGAVVQETRLWNEEKGVTASMRSKEEAHDYRYFPEPDLIPMVVPVERVEAIRAALPELPAAKRARYERDFGLSAYDARVLADDRAQAEFFDEAVATHAQLGGRPALEAATGTVSQAGAPPGSPKALANWLMGDVAAGLNAEKKGYDAIAIRPAQLAGLVRLVETDALSGKMAKTVLAEMMKSGKDPEALVQELGLSLISDAGELARIVSEVVDANPKAVEEYRAGKTKITGFLVGQIMKITKGSAKPEVLNPLLLEELDRRVATPR